MHPNSIILALKNHLRFIISLLFFLFLAFTVHAQKASSIEKMAAYGYSKRFSDTSSCKKMQQLALDLAKKKNNIDDKIICYSYLALTQRRLLHLKEFSHYADSAY